MGDVILCQIECEKLYVANAITQEYYGYDNVKYVSYDGIEKAFQTIVKMNMHNNLPICFPKIGSHLGGGNWKIISTIIDETVPNTMEKRLYVI